MTGSGSPRRDGTPCVLIDPVSGRGVFVAPRRAERPDDAALGAGLAAERSHPEQWCPFCAGNEQRTPPDILRAPADVRQPWRSRIVANRYPITDGATDGATAAIDAAGALPGGGVHDVVIESPRHERSVLGVEPTAWREAWWLVRQRLAMLAERPALTWATVFKNSGSRAGASLEHVHSQVIGLALVPPVIESEVAGAARDPGCFSNVIAIARADGRIVAEKADVVALVPPAPRQPYETWILPIAAERHFHATTPERVAAVADLTRDIVARLEIVSPDAHFNWWLHQAPFLRAAADEQRTRHWHWHVELLPRLAQLAGFELGTGCHVTTLPPTAAAQRLRAAEVHRFS